MVNTILIGNIFNYKVMGKFSFSLSKFEQETFLEKYSDNCYEFSERNELFIETKMRQTEGILMKFNSNV